MGVSEGERGSASIMHVFAAARACFEWLLRVSLKLRERERE